MLTDPITLEVDDDNDGGTTPAIQMAYRRYSEEQNKSSYIGENHSQAARDMIGFTRALPKVNGNFKGTEKGSFKFTVDRVVVGVNGENITAPQILEVSFSNPVGVSEAQKLDLRMRASAMLRLDDVMDDFLGLLMI